MRMYYSVLTFACVIFLYCPIATADQPDSTDSFTRKNVAVLTLQNADGFSAGDAALMTDRLNAELFTTGRVAIMEREQIQDVLQEQGFQKSGACNEENCLVEIGQLLGVEQIISGSLGQLGSLYLINVRIIDVATGEIVTVVSEDVQGTIEDVVKSLGVIARKLVGLPVVEQKQRTTPSTVEKKTTEEIKPTRNAAMLVALSNPPGAQVLLNGEEIGKTPFIDNAILPGTYTLTLRAPRYEEYSQTISLEKGIARRVAANLMYKYAVLTITTQPEKATILLDEKNAGHSPWRNDTLSPGTYKLELALDGYKPISDKVDLVQGLSDTLSFTLFTESYLDSARIIKREQTKGRRWARRIIFGTLAAGAWTSGVIMNTRAEKSIAEEEDILESYPNITGQINIETAEEQWEKQKNTSNQYMLIRNILYGVGGGFTLFLGLSIPF